MTVDQMIGRINELYHKSQAEGLTDAEKEEQQALRQAYVANVRANLKGQLDNISIVEKDGSITDLGEKFGNKRKEIRKRSLSIRNAIPAEDRKAHSEKIKEKMLQLSCYREADVILAYVSYRSEVDTFGLIAQALASGKRVFAPKVKGEEMEFWQIKSLEDLQSGYHGILEPAETVSYPVYRAACLDRGETVSTLMWMPGAVFDRTCCRIGYGGGFYDKYLDRLCRREKTLCGRKEEAGLTTIALAYSCQVLEKIPSEAHDYRPDFILTEQGLIEKKS